MDQQAVCILESPEHELQCRNMSDRYSLPRVRKISEIPAKYALRYQDGALKLWDLREPKFRPVFFDARQTRRIGRNNLLGKAMGRKTSTVADATAGLGHDTMLLARMGFSVIAIERVPVISALLEDGIARAKSTQQHLRIQHRFGDSRELLQKSSVRADAIYLDPMYPEGRKKSVKVARPLKILRELAGDDPDSADLLQTALRSKAKRIIVKRPIYAAPLCPQALAGSLKGKMVRYDIYVRTT